MNIEPFARFVEFVEMDRWADISYKSYDLMWRYTQKRVLKALSRLGRNDGPLYFRLSSLQADLDNRGVKVSELETLLAEWFVWDRIIRGEVRNWPLRKGSTGNE